MAIIEHHLDASYKIPKRPDDIPVDNTTKSMTALRTELAADFGPAKYSPEDVKNHILGLGSSKLSSLEMDKFNPTRSMVSTRKVTRTTLTWPCPASDFDDVRDRLTLEFPNILACHLDADTCNNHIAVRFRDVPAALHLLHLTPDLLYIAWMPPRPAAIICEESTPEGTQPIPEENEDPQKYGIVFPLVERRPQRLQPPAAPFVRLDGIGSKIDPGGLITVLPHFANVIGHPVVPTQYMYVLKAEGFKTSPVTLHLPTIGGATEYADLGTRHIRDQNTGAVAKLRFSSIKQGPLPDIKKTDPVHLKFPANVLKPKPSSNVAVTTTAAQSSNDPPGAAKAKAAPATGKAAAKAEPSDAPAPANHIAKPP